jgi:three-Cys-motif partner protein
MPKADLNNYLNREQAFVKHVLLEKYLVPWAYKVGAKWDSLVYVDGFAGPWETTRPDYADSSFGVVLDALSDCQRGLFKKGNSCNFHSFLVEREAEPYVKLKAYAESRDQRGFRVESLNGAVADLVSQINQSIKSRYTNPFKFVFLDPKGWADIPMEKLAPFLNDRSSEVLINLMTRHINRFLDQPTRAESYNQLFGRPGVLDALQKVPTGNDQRAEQAVREYCRSLKQVCDYRYVSSAVILEPAKKAIRYFLVYASNHPDGIEVFKNAEIAAAQLQDSIKHEKDVQKTLQNTLDFNDGPRTDYAFGLRQRYLEMARQALKKRLRKSGVGKLIAYEELFCEALGYPLVTPNDLVEMLDRLKPGVVSILKGELRKKIAPGMGDVVVVKDLACLGPGE